MEKLTPKVKKLMLLRTRIEYHEKLATHHERALSKLAKEMLALLATKTAVAELNEKDPELLNKYLEVLARHNANNH